MSDLEARDGAPRRGALPSDEHAPLINEYGWLWLNRDGSPTRLTGKVYAHLMGTTNAPARERLNLYSYLLAGKTEFWRAHRHYAGIIHFVYLTCSYPEVYTADHFSDVARLKLDPAFEEYVGEAFKPLGVYINFFQPSLTAGQVRTFKIMMANDYAGPVDGTLALSLQTRHGQELCRVESPFEIGSAGASSYDLSLPVPSSASGPCVLKAVARSAQKLRPKTGPTVSRRWVTVK
jgi:hypothetical protein